MKEKRTRIFLFLIIFLSLIIRLYKLGNLPPSMHWDETSWGYNAWSILKTGKDEYGKPFPLILKAFGDYKPPIYVYLTVISEAIFGLNEFAVRFPAALFGTLSIYLTYLVVKELFKEFKGKEAVALLTSFLLAFSPWHYHYSRAAWEINILFVFLLLGVYCFLKEKLVVSGLFFGLCFHIYNSAKLVVPLTILGLIFFFPKKFKKKSWAETAIAFTLLSVLVLPVFYFTFFDGAGGRLKVMSVLSYPRNDQEAIRLASEMNTTPKNFIYKIYHGKPMFFFREILWHYLNHFSAKFLFFEGDWTDARHSVPYTGQLNLLNIFFLPAGAFYLISQKIKKQGFLWFFLAISPLPAAFSRNIVQATRSFFMVLPLNVIGAFGAYFVFEKTKNLKPAFKNSFYLLLFLTFVFSFVYYIDNFFVHAPIANSSEWLYGYKEAVQFILNKKDRYQKIVFTQKYGQPYIYYLFYTQYPPEKYQKQAKLIEHPEGDVGRVEKVDNIEFREIYWPADRNFSNTLFVGTPYELPIQDIDNQQAKILKEIKYLNDEVAFRIVETK